jgi:hypothetical protein
MNAFIDTGSVMVVWVLQFQLLLKVPPISPSKQAMI